MSRQRYNMLTCLATTLLLAVHCLQTSSSTPAAEPLRVGMIGLDTSHAPAFAKLINAEGNEGALGQLRVVAAFPGGSPDLPSSRDRVDGFTKQLGDMGIEIFDSIDTLLPKVDAVLLESVDGRVHLSQVLPVFKARKPVFIDKPLAADLADALAIDLAAQKYDARWFSSSSLRFSPGILMYRSGETKAGKPQGVVAWSPCSLDPTHSDLFWYGIHGVEILFTTMGTGCEQVTRIGTEGTDVAVGIWENGRIGTFRGLRDGKQDYGLVVFGEQAIELGGKYEGYRPLVEQIAEFFVNDTQPVSNAETIEMMAFMQAADRSGELGGQPVSLPELVEEYKPLAAARLAELDP